MRSLLARLAVLGALAAVMSGCSTSTSPLPNSGPASSGGGGVSNLAVYSNPSAYVRFVQGNSSFKTATPPAIFICVDQSTVGATALGFGQTAALTLPAGPHIVSVYGPSTVNAAQAGVPSPCSNAPNIVTSIPTSTNPTGAAQQLLALYNLTVAANTRYAVVLGGTGAIPAAYGFQDVIPPAAQSVPAVLFHAAAATVPVPAPVGTASPSPAQNNLGFTPTGGTAGSLGSATTLQTPTAGNKQPPASIAFATNNAIALNPTTAGAGAFYLGNGYAATTPIVSTNVSGTTAPVTSIFALDAGGTPAAQVLVTTTDPSFAQLGF